MRNLRITDEKIIYYKNFIIDYSKSFKYKISVFDLNNNFYGDYNFIMEAKNLINKNLMTEIL